MAVTLRMSRGGRKKEPFYRIVAADSRSARDGKFLEIVGTFHPKTKEVKINKESAEKWVGQGATISDSVKQIFLKQGLPVASQQVAGS